MCVAPHKSGFTLTDLLITLILIGIFSLVVLPTFQGLTEVTKLDSATTELTSALEYAGSLAVRYRRPFRVRISGKYNAIGVIDRRFEEDGLNNHPDADPPVWRYGIVAHPVNKTRYIVDYDDDDRLAGASISTGSEARDITFYPDGHCSTEAATITVSFGKESRTVSIDGITGRITAR